MRPYSGIEQRERLNKLFRLTAADFEKARQKRLRMARIGIGFEIAWVVVWSSQILWPGITSWPHGALLGLGYGLSLFSLVTRVRAYRSARVL